MAISLNQLLVRYVYAQLRDSTNKIRWTRDELTQYVNLALRDIVARRPEAGLVVDEDLNLVAGALQPLPAGAIRLKEIVENLAPRAFVCLMSLEVVDDPDTAPVIDGQQVTFTVQNDGDTTFVRDYRAFDALTQLVVFAFTTTMSAAFDEGMPGSTAFTGSVSVSSDNAAFLIIQYQARRDGTFQFLYSVGGTPVGPAPVATASAVHHVFVDGPARQVSVYIDSVLQFTASYAAHQTGFNLEVSRVVTGLLVDSAAGNTGKEFSVLFNADSAALGAWPGATDLCGTSL